MGSRSNIDNVSCIMDVDLFTIKEDELGMF